MAGFAVLGALLSAVTSSTLGIRRPMAVPQAANERWSLDFISDALTDGWRFRVLAVVDDFTRECLTRRRHVSVWRPGRVGTGRGHRSTGAPEQDRQ